MNKNNLKKSMTYKTDSKIILTYSNHDNKHGICGHFFEVIDYYIFLKKTTSYSIEIVIGEDIHPNDIDIALSKYKKAVVKKINFVFERPRIFDCKESIIIITDGLLDNTKIYNCKNIILFPCGTRTYKKFPKFLENNILILYDFRLKYNIPESITQIDYIKKINFLELVSLKSIQSKSKKYLTLYATSNCKLIQENTIYRIRKEYPNLPILLLINPDSPLLQFKSELKEINVELRFVPIHNLFEKIDTYLYTSIARKWDCSPRMLAECKFYGIPYLLDNDINDEYLSDDLGLKYRLEDIKNDFESLYLKENDSIIEVIDSLFKEKN